MALRCTDTAPATACDEIIDFIVAGKSPEQIDAFRPSEETLTRASHLIELAKADALSSEERTELEDFLQARTPDDRGQARARRNSQR
jgi:hypothetical protein